MSLHISSHWLVCLIINPSTYSIQNYVNQAQSSTGSLAFFPEGVTETLHNVKCQRVDSPNTKKYIIWTFPCGKEMSKCPNSDDHGRWQWQCFTSRDGQKGYRFTCATCKAENKQPSPSKVRVACTCVCSSRWKWRWCAHTVLMHLVLFTAKMCTALSFTVPAWAVPQKSHVHANYICAVFVSSTSSHSLCHAFTKRWGSHSWTRCPVESCKALYKYNSGKKSLRTVQKHNNKCFGSLKVRKSLGRIYGFAVSLSLPRSSKNILFFGD